MHEVARPTHLRRARRVISGTVQVGRTLTVDTSGIADEDGTVNATFAYQWVRIDGITDSEIQGGTGPTYILTSDDEGKTIKVRVIFTDDAGNTETLTSSTTSIRGCQTQQRRHRPAYDQRDCTGWRDIDGGRNRHRGFGRTGQRDLRLPVVSGRCLH